MRLIRYRSGEEARRELERVGTDSWGIEAMVPKMELCLVMVEDVPCRAANVMKQEMLSLGGDVAVARGSVSCSIEKTTALVMGTRKQVDRFIDKLAFQPFGLDDIAAGMKDVLQKARRETFSLTTPRRTITVGERTLVMGIINMTPDSFSDGGRFASMEEALEEALRMEEEGADIIDVGGESTRPGSDLLKPDEEMGRVIPLLRALRKRLSIPLSIDTTKAAVARAAIDEGAEIINDISALRFDEDMAALAASAGVPVILMHMRGTPKTMQEGDLAYDSLHGEIGTFFRERIEAALSAGIDEENIILDPGIGFGKTAADNCRLIARMDEFRCLGRPLLVGPSRKRFIGETVGGSPAERLEGTAAAVTVSILAGASIVRVHDVAFMKPVAVMADSFRKSGAGP
ncbi:MAG: dihydropteroate synthase [Syntrophales bacterium]|jgi:dihydropteroate synthase|nr:dihydropteroate synthase [Syntrophales bacterium]MCK9527970.1 dihydropteroate synthase [Syntrophales bacterium]MDX9921454.1 dihydropteroate synthase [Syntrophales bacterium]